MMWLNLVGIQLLARFLLVILFPFSALDKIINYKQALQQAKSSFLPGGRVLLVVAIVVEIVTPICIVLAWHDRLAAFILAGFCAVTALLYHEFWKYDDFWAQGDSKARSHFWDFLKNFGLVGGLMMIVLLGNFIPATSVLSQPLSSAPLGAWPQ